MAYILKFQVVGDQEAINKTKRVYSEGEKNATASAGKIKDRFRDVFENVTQNATGSFGSVAGGLFKLPGIAGAAAAGVLAAFGGMIAAANKYAQANAATDAASARFLGTIDRLKAGFSSTVGVVGSVAVTVFNRLAEVFGIAGTKADELRAKYNATISNLKTRKDEINEIVAALRLREESTGALRPLLEAADKLKALENERNKVLVSIESTEKNIATARGEAYKQQGLAYLLDKKTRDEFDKKLAAQNLSLVPLQAQLENLNQQVAAAEQLLLSEQKRYEGAGKATAQIIASKTQELELEKQIDVSQAGRKAFLEGRALAEKAYAENQKRNLDRQSREEEFQESRRKAADERARAALQAQEAAARALGNTMRSFVLNSLEQIVFEGGKFHDILKEITRSALRLGFRLITQGIFGGGFENGGVLGRIPQAANGMHVNRDSLIRVGERNLPEVIIPLAPEKRARANELLAQSGLAAGNQTINFAPVIYANNADRNLVRELMVQFNRETKRGARLFATNQKSNRR